MKGKLYYPGPGRHRSTVSSAEPAGVSKMRQITTDCHYTNAETGRKNIDRDFPFPRNNLQDLIMPFISFHICTWLMLDLHWRIAPIRNIQHLTILYRRLVSHDTRSHVAGRFPGIYGRHPIMRDGIDKLMHQVRV